MPTSVCKHNFVPGIDGKALQIKIRDKENTVYNPAQPFNSKLGGIMFRCRMDNAKENGHIFKLASGNQTKLTAGLTLDSKAIINVSRLKGRPALTCIRACRARPATS